MLTYRFMKTAILTVTYSNLFHGTPENIGEWS
jgi:hypothetical protein